MSGNRSGRAIHPRALEALGLEAAVTMLGVARDLRSGAIREENYRQGCWYLKGECGTACCIAGHTALRLGVPATALAVQGWAELAIMGGDDGLWRLFSAVVGARPAEAADAIEAYMYGGARDPWRRR